jgi:hypothetical protein
MRIVCEGVSGCVCKMETYAAEWRKLESMFRLIVANFSVVQVEVSKVLHMAA